MREIKFRAWYDSPKIMSYTPEFHGKVNEIFNKGLHTYMQFTGLTDRNGVEIYEGDIYSATSVSGLIGTVLYKTGRVVISTEGGNDYPITLYEGEVIGNIYEHPHLIEGVK